MAQQNPFGTGGAGANAFKAAYDRLKAEADAARQGIGENYASAYQQLRQQGYGAGLGAAAQRGLSGGQAAGVRGAIGAQQMGQLGELMQGQERALREQKVGEQSIYSNALLEGRQAQQYEREDQQYNLQREQQGASVLANNELSDEQKRAQLSALGYPAEQIETMIGASNQPGFFQQLGQFAQRTFAPMTTPTGGNASTAGGNFLTGAARGAVGVLGGPLAGAYTNSLNLYDFVRNLLRGRGQQQEASTVSAPDMGNFTPPTRG
jgi:hypothetical protein